APVAFAGLTGAAKMTAKCKKCGCCDIACICAKGNGFDDIRCTADGTADNKRNIVADTLITQTLINRCERQFNRNTDIISNSCRSSTRAAAEAVNRDNIRAASGNA